MLRMLARFTAVICALFAAQAFAVGLGDINVRSKLNQRFSATIPVLGATASQLDAFTVKLASPEEFNRAGIERSDYLSTLKFTVEEVPAGARVVVSSDQIAREPFLNFILEARSPDGKLLREYTVLLDPPTVGQAENEAPVAAAPAQAYNPPPAPVVQVENPNSEHVTPSHLAPDEATQLAAEMAKRKPGVPAKAPKPAKAPRAPKPAPAQALAAAPAEAPPAESAPMEAAPPAASASGSRGTYGPIAAQETFWSVATKLRPSPKVTMDQVLLAIYRANPAAFDRGSFNGLLKGRTLQVPSQAEMEETAPAQAKTEVAAWRNGSHPSGGIKKNPSDLAAPGSPAAAAPVEKPKPAKSKPAKPAAEAKPLLPPPAPVAPAPQPPPAAVKPEPKPEPKAEIKPAPAPAPAPQAVAPAPAPATPAVQAPAPAAAAPAATPAPAAATPEPTPAPAAAASPPAEAPAPSPKRALPPPPPEPGLLDNPMMLIGGVVTLAVVGFFIWFMFLRKRKPLVPDFTAKAGATSKKAAAPSLKPGPAPKKGAAPAPPPLPPKPQPMKLGDTTALPDEKPLPLPRPQLAPQAAMDLGRTQVNEPVLARTSLDDTARMKAADAVALKPQRVLEQSIPQATPAPVGGGDVDFDLTSQFEAQTLSINLDANDPLSEADFHLAYGLYDEAASLLKQALAKEPQRQDLRQKLAETYFAGGKPMEFQETAEALQGHISASEWQKIAIMGRQLSPDAPLFKADGAAPVPDIDLSLGDSIGPAPMQVIGASPPQTAAPKANVIDFDLDSELMKAMPATGGKPAAPEEKADFDLSHFDFSAEPHPAPAEGTVEFDLDDLDLSKPAGSSGVASGDEIGTKLDLARVYADMGDNEAARGLLNEVVGTGNATQKGEAEALLKRLSA